MSFAIAQYLDAVVNESPEAKALLSIRNRLMTGEESMTCDLMVRIVRSFDKVEVYPNPFNSLEPWECVAISDLWLDRWVEAAQPDWLDAFYLVLLDPPRGFSLNRADFPDDAFQALYKGIAERFPERALAGLEVILQEETTYPLLAALLFTSYLDSYRGISRDAFMDHDLMVQLLQSFNEKRATPSPWSNPEEWARVQSNDDWMENWLEYARPEWLDSLNNLLIMAPPTLSLEPPRPQFSILYHEVALRFPQQALYKLKPVLSHREALPSLAKLFFLIL